MELLFQSRTEQEKAELYSEYLKKIPELLKQLDSVELMYTKALAEEKMLEDKDPASVSVKLYDDRLRRTITQCETRMTDIKDQLALIFALKNELEQTSYAIRTLSGQKAGKESDMTLMEMMLHRRSVRKYTDQPIPEELLKTVINAGLAAPTGKNTSDREFIVVTDKETLVKLSETRIGAAKMLAGAGAAIVVFGDPQISDTWIEDCSIALTQMHLMADSLGLGSCWIQGRMRPAPDGRTTDEAIKEILGVPEGLRLVATLSVGCIDSHPEAKVPEDLEIEKVHYGRF